MFICHLNFEIILNSSFQLLNSTTPLDKNIKRNIIENRETGWVAGTLVALPNVSLRQCEETWHHLPLF
jgi:hypothetical protein